VTDPATMPPPPELKRRVFDALVDKAALPLRSMVLLGMLAGIYIGIGGLFATIALTGASGLPYGAGQVLAGLVFATGLGVVMIAGAELFTGNTMMMGPVVTGEIVWRRAVRALVVVYGANFAGALLLAGLVFGVGLHEGQDGAIGRAAVDLAQGKTDGGFFATFASGILANVLVCLAVWCAYAGQTVTQKLGGLVLPVAAFVAAGLEHSVANMYLLPYGWLVQPPLSEGPQPITVASILCNLVASTIGNIVGGAIVALGYAAAFAESGSASAAEMSGKERGET